MGYLKRPSRIYKVVSISLVLTFSSLVILPEASACWWKGLPSARAEIAKLSEQSGHNDNLPNQPSTRDPVFIHNGDYVYTKEDLLIPGRVLNLEITRTYKSQSRYNGRFGFGWEFNFNQRLVFLANGNIYYFDGQLGRHLYTYLDGTNFIPPLYRFDRLKANPEGTYTLTQKDNTKYLFNSRGWLIQITDRNNNSLSFEYEDNTEQPVIGFAKHAPLISPTPKVIAYVPKLSKITDSLKRTINLSYDERGRLKTITDFAARTWTYTYNQINELISVTTPPTQDYPQGLTTTYTYDSAHNLTQITDPKGQTYLINKYDSSDRVIEQTYGSGTYYFSYDEQNNITTVTDPKGYETRWTYNSTGNPLKKEEFTESLRSADPTSYVTTYSYDMHMQPLKITSPKGNWVKYSYDNKGNLLQIRRKMIEAADVNDPVNDIVTAFTYESRFNFIKTITDPQGKTTTYTYDYELNPQHPDYAENGNLVKITYPPVGTVTAQVQFTYNDYGQVETITDPNGVVTKYVYYPTTGYLKQIINDFGADGFNYTTEMTYDSLGNVTSIKDARGNTTTFTYNALTQLTQTTSPAPFNYITKYQYDENGNLKKIERQANDTATVWQTTTYTYDVLDKLKTITDNLNNVTTFDYDANGNRTKITDAEGNLTSYLYDERNLLWKVTDALDNISEYTYDENGNLKELKDARSNKTTYLYDDFDRLITTTYQDTTTEQYTYDKNSNLDTKIDQKNQTLDYDYDYLNRLKLKTYPDATTVQYLYDAASRLTDVIDSNGTIHYDYDNLNRVKLVTYPDTKQVSYEYDELGNRTKLTYPDSTYITYEYDALNRLTKIKDQSANTIASYTYDVLSRRTQLDYLNSTQTIYQYDNVNRLTSLTNTYNPTPNAYSYTYDDVGNRLSLVTSDGTNNYTYDKIYQLKTVDYPQGYSFPDITFNYDSVGNRTSTLNGGTTNYTTNNLNQYTKVSAANYTYDQNGNLTSDGTTTYSYDYENRLVSSLRGAAAGGDEAIYTYDAFGRRTKKEVTINNQPSTINYLYDGDQAIAETDATGTTTAKYIFGPGIDEPILMEKGGERYYYHFDGLGSVTSLTSQTGQTSETYTYDAYGQPNTISSIGNRFMFTGREYDSETGLYYYRARYYSPSMGRFLQRDPVGYIAGINLYSYVVNNPVNFVDPFGWDKDKPWWEKTWDWWSDLVAPGEGGVIAAKPGESWEEYFERFRRERIYEFAASEALGIAGGWTSIGTTTAHSSFTEGLRLTGSKLGNRFVSIGGKGFWYMRDVPEAMKWRQVASGAAKGSAITWVITSAATGYRIGLQLDAWLSYKLTRHQ